MTFLNPWRGMFWFSFCDVFFVNNFIFTLILTKICFDPLSVRAWLGNKYCPDALCINRFIRFTHKFFYRNHHVPITPFALVGRNRNVFPTANVTKQICQKRSIYLCGIDLKKRKTADEKVVILITFIYFDWTITIYLYIESCQHEREQLVSN